MWPPLIPVQQVLGDNDRAGTRTYPETKKPDLPGECSGDTG